MWFDQSAVRIRAGRKSDRGNTDGSVLDWSPAAVDLLPLANLNIQPRVQQESVEEQRDAVVTGWRVQSDQGVDLDVTALDRFEWDGMTLDVDGEIARWPDPTEGGIHHVEFDLKRVTG